MAQWSAPYRPERGYLSPRERRRLARRTAVRPRVRRRDLSSHTDPLAAKALKQIK